MDTRKVAAEYRLSHWMHLIQEQQSSGLNIKEFCREKGMSRHVYFYWRRKLRKAACEELSKSGGPSNIVPSGWMQLDLGQQTKTTLDIEVGGCRVTVNEETDPELLKKVCRILRVL
ncbi:MAG: transposase [Syntrophomonadaceae bacterium]|nr:transposase [Syntrophomonadaceae bacterium]